MKKALITVLLLIIVVGSISYTYTHTEPYLSKKRFETGQSMFAELRFKEGVELMSPLLKPAHPLYHELLTFYRGQLNTADFARWGEANTVDLLVSLASIDRLRMSSISLAKSALEQTSLSEFSRAQITYMLSQSVESEEQAVSYRQQAHQHYASNLSLLEHDLENTLKFAQLEEKLAGCERCETLLLVHEALLGETEGARILGQYYVGTREYEKAYAWLQPYTESKLDIYRKAEIQLDGLLDSIWSETVDSLNSGSAPDAFYDAYNAADEDEQNRLINEKYIKRRDTSELYQGSLARFRDAAKVVPVALDLGIVMLSRAMLVADDEERNKQLLNAEETFLAVKGYAGDTDDYQLYLGQVYFWLGKDEDGDALFSQLAEKYQRDPQVLYSLSTTLRSLGDDIRAKAYALEAYEKSEDQETRFSLARQMYLLTQESSERIEWLEKSDQNDDQVQANLLTQKAHLALEDNKESEALSLFKQAVVVYDRMPSSASVLNNSALVYLSLFNLSENKTHYHMGLSKLDEALSLVPDDTIILTNSAENHLLNVIRESLEPYYSASLINQDTTMDMFRRLYVNNEGRQPLIDAIKEHPSFAKWHDYTIRAITLAPKNVSLINNTLSMYRYLKMDDEINMLAKRIQNREFDLSESIESIESYRRGEKDQDYIDYYTANRERLMDKLAQANIVKNAIEANYYKNEILSNKLNQTANKIDAFNADTLLQEALGLQKNNVSSWSKALVRQALVLKVTQDMYTQSKDFKTFYDTYHRIYSSVDVLSLYALSNPIAKQQLKSNETIKQFAASVVKDLADFPKSASYDICLLFHVLDNEKTSALIQDALADISKIDVLQIQAKTTALTESQWLSRYLGARFTKQDAKAKALYKQALESKWLLPENLDTSITL